MASSLNREMALHFADTVDDQVAAENSFSDYVRLAWPVIEPATPFLSNWHINALTEHLISCTRREITRLVINVVPRTGKSRIVSVLWPTFVWGPYNQPAERWLFATWDDELASQQSEDRRYLMTSDWYKRQWGRRFIFRRRDADRTLRYVNSARGQMFATTMGRGSLGHGGNCLRGDTLISTECGRMRIDRLVRMFPRPRVLTYNHDRNVCEYRQIKMARVSTRREFVRLKIEGTDLFITPEHGVYSPDSLDYQPAEAFGINSKVLRLADDNVALYEALYDLRPAQVKSVSVAESVRICNEGIPVYDLEVEGNSNFFANGILVHNCIVIDDPHNTKVVESDVQRQTVLNTFDQDISRRLNDKEKGVIVLIAQRLHHEDMTQHFLELYPNAVHLNLPAIAEERTIVHIRPPQAGPPIRIKIRESGDLLWPEREGPTQIAEAKLVLGPYGFASQYQQSPSPKTGAIFTPDKYRYYKMLPPLRRMVGSWDTAAKTKEQNDFSAYCLWGQATREYGSQLFLLHLFVAKMMAPELKRRVRTLYQAGCPLAFIGGASVPCNLKYAEAVLMEDSSAGQSIIQEIKAYDWDDIVEGGEGDSLFLPVTPVKVTTDKVARANAAVPMLDAGYAQLPDPAVFDVPWLDGLLNSMRRFPVGAHDDDIDSMTQALNYMRDNDEPGIIGYYRKLAEKEAARQKALETGQPPPPSIEEDDEDDFANNEAVQAYEEAEKEWAEYFNNR